MASPSRVPRRLLLTGIPGTGKTEAGHTLASQHGFLHLDAERFAQEAPAGTTWADFVGVVAASTERDVVITWGFMPGTDDAFVRRLQGMGFRMVWFDGDRSAALRVFTARGTVSQAAFDAQMARIGRLDLNSFSPAMFDPFDSGGAFLSREEIARRLVALG